MLFSCSSSSDDNNSSNLEFHPPAWIQGTWYAYPFNDKRNSVETAYVFLANNILKYGGEISNPNSIDDYNIKYGKSNFKEEYFANKYVITFSFTSGGTTVVLKQNYFKVNNDSFVFTSREQIDNSELYFYKIK